MFKKFILALLLCAMLALGLTACGDDENTTATRSPSSAGGATPSPSPSPSATPGPSSITINIPSGAATMGNDAFGINPMVVTMGTTVTWVNHDSMAHTATSTSGAFNSGSIAPGDSFSFTFNTAGDFPYFCEIHPTMRGTIRVTQ